MYELGQGIGKVISFVFLTLFIGVISGLCACWALLVYEIAKFTFNIIVQ